MNRDDFSDPSDWNNTSLSAISPLDSNLRCLICKDFYTAPVITSCLHTFCSLCIRRSLSTEAICPACRTTNISDSGLRQNKVVADLVENFVAVRCLYTKSHANVDHVCWKSRMVNRRILPHRIPHLLPCNQPTVFEQKTICQSQES